MSSRLCNQLFLRSNLAIYIYVHYTYTVLCVWLNPLCAHVKATRKFLFKQITEDKRFIYNMI